MAAMNKLEKITFYIFIFLLPFQIGGLIFSFQPLETSFYHQIFLYLSDILILVLIGFWILRMFKDAKEKIILAESLKKDFILILFFLISGFSIIVAANKGLAVFHLVKLFEFLLLYFYTKQNFKNFDIKKVFLILIIAALFQVFISSLQFYLQESIGLKYFGESPLSPIIDGVAKINEDGFKMIRAYGTFPHPNILALFLSFALFLPYYLYLRNGAENKAKDIFYVLLFFAFSVGLFLTFSRAAIFSFAIISFLFFAFLILRKNSVFDKAKIYKLAALSALFFLTLVFVFNKEIISRLFEDQSLSQRIYYANVAREAIFKNPFFGVGIGNFIDYFYGNFPNLSNWQYQPVHNLFLLTATEIGIFGALLFLFFIVKSLFESLKKIENLFQYIILFSFLNFLILASTDHYFWTLQQGQILFWLALGILNSNKN